ncbi:peptidase s11 d-alanyl-d-alanine carboxypeptidase a [Lucifera butyrica]|uniref:Peptidase s11 d-alanyl-d-alanine carboxypeptidase a n=1 Tax=Lucifera butyrica TaxID=1351585 RepID=A0A498RAH4_9FIRM|nr:D-alanyl-D-alanine carboxypeptidase [Lucifera butyrica]VBB08339.1 peptidase s11 d-alanyl-d-alanine carboxypeptidase a [Lucifera butyrica]VBB08411.1 peptidase s11 d-alanyl-d-alanine carboxypeptidase a [Lucifera butyrica]
MAKPPSKDSILLFNKFSFKRKIPILLIIALICVISIVHFYRNSPGIEVKPMSPTVTLPGQFSVTFPKQGESAIGTSKFGVIAASSDQSSIPIASVTKIMTAYLVLKVHPLRPGEDGPVITMTAKDVSNYLNDASHGDSTVAVSEGEKLTERQLLEGLMLPSGDNIASTLARWISGSETAFVTKMNETAQSLGMTETHYEDASGVNPASVSNAVDQIKITQVAMEDPVFRQIVATPKVTFPIEGTIYNVNKMLGYHGIAGVKTGSSSSAGGCFVSAATIDVGTEPHYIIGVVLGQWTDHPLANAINENAKMLDEVRSEFKLYPITPPPAGFGQVINAWHSNSALYSSEPVQIFGYPGMTAALSINLLKNQLPIPQGENIATLKIQSGQYVKEFPLQNSVQINPPNVLWRLFRNWI